MRLDSKKHFYKKFYPFNLDGNKYNITCIKITVEKLLKIHLNNKINHLNLKKSLIKTKLFWSGLFLRDRWRRQNLEFNKYIYYRGKQNASK